MSGGKLLAAVGILTAWYIYSGNHDRFNPHREHHQTPLQCSQSCNLEDRIRYQLPEIIETVKGPLPTASIDFEGDVEIKTARYTFEKNEDFFLFRWIGHLGSTPAKLFFWEYNAGLGIDSLRAQRVLAMLENDKSIENVTVRLNHNLVWNDLFRLFADEKVTERNNVIARVLMGIPTILFGELWAELFRGDYYNPMTQTTVLYSNIDAVWLHELGHHRDHQRFTSDWEYSLTRMIPPVMVYQEWKASDYAKEDLTNQQKYQHARYLIPALSTYVLAALLALSRFFREASDDDD